MKTFCLLSLLLAVSYDVTSAFTTSARSPAFASTTSLHLFGSGDKGGDAKGPGMMDQLAMFKKAQEMAQKKNKLDEELKKESFQGTAADGNVKVTFKYVPMASPMDPNPDYEVTAIDFDDAYYEGASPEDLSTAVQGAIMNGIQVVGEAVTAKYQVLQGDLLEAFGGGGKAE